MEILAHWWDQQHGMLARLDVWVEKLSDGQYQVRWRGGDWRDRDGSFRAPDRGDAWAAVRQLLDNGSDWQRIDRAAIKAASQDRDRAQTQPHHHRHTDPPQGT
jgi:hypothetical protein